MDKLNFKFLFQIENVKHNLPNLNCDWLFHALSWISGRITCRLRPGIANSPAYPPPPSWRVPNSWPTCPPSVDLPANHSAACPPAQPNAPKSFNLAACHYPSIRANFRPLSTEWICTKVLHPHFSYFPFSAHLLIQSMYASTNFITISTIRIHSNPSPCIQFYCLT